MPDQRRAVAGDVAIHVHLGRLVGVFAVVDKADMTLLVRIDVVEARHRIDRHGGLPLFKIARLVLAEILQGLIDFAHARPTQRIGAARPLQHRAVNRMQHGLMEGPCERTQQLDAQCGICDLEVLPFAVEQVLPVIRRIQRQLIDADQLGLVDRVRPAQVLVVTVQHERRTGEEATGHVPPLIALQHRFIPGHGARIGLV